MFSKLFSTVALVLALSLQVHGHAAIVPVLGVTGTPARSDVQRPSTASPCGKTNPATAIDASTPVVAAANGQFKVTVTNFNAGKDGSRQITGTLDTTGAGKTFAGAVTVVGTNGDAAPTNVGSQDVTLALPAGTACTGGAAGNLCLVSFKTAGGFGNCVVVQSGAAGAATGAAAGAAAAGTAAATTAAAAGTAAAGTATGAGAATAAAGTTTKTKGGKKAAKAAAKAAAAAAAAAAPAAAAPVAAAAATKGKGKGAAKAAAAAAKGAAAAAPAAVAPVAAKVAKVAKLPCNVGGTRAACASLLMS